MQILSALRSQKFAERFRGYLPFCIDIETSGLSPKRHGITQIAVQFLQRDIQQQWIGGMPYCWDVALDSKFEVDPQSVQITGIDPLDTKRFCLPEQQVLKQLGKLLKHKLEENACHKAILIGHNVGFDRDFLLSALSRHKLIWPIHSFSSIDTATLAITLTGHNVLATSCARLGLYTSNNSSHDAVYDVVKCTQLFLFCINRWESLHDKNTDF